MMRTDAPERAEIVAIGEGFQDRSFPGARFHHREHLILTTYLIVLHPELDWRRELPDLIRAYNIAQGGVNDEDRGYHHTITLAFLSLVEDIVSMVGSGDLEAACSAVLASPAAGRDALLQFYSRERLFSRAARAEWLEPDLAELRFSNLLALSPS